MKRKVTVLVLVGLTLVLILAVFGSQALADGGWGRSERARPFKASYTTYPEIVEFGEDYIVLHIPGEGKGTHLGKSTWLAEGMRVDLVEPPQPQVSTMVFTSSGGDELYGHFFGLGYPNSAGANYYWGGYEINGGTGRFEGASGSGLYHGRCGEELCDASFEGILRYP